MNKTTVHTCSIAEKSISFRVFEIKRKVFFLINKLFDYSNRYDACIFYVGIKQMTMSDVCEIALNDADRSYTV